MDIFLSHITALWALRRWDVRRRLERGERCSVPVPACAPPVDDLDQLGKYAPPSISGEKYIELVVASGRPGPCGMSGCLHLERAPLPEESAVRLADGIVCAAPELVIVQLASRLTDLELMMLIAELTGLYAISSQSEDGMFQRDAPITTPERIRAYLDQLGPRAETRRVRWALDRAPVLSGSPRESKLALRYTLRPGLGGWNIPLLAMNAPIEVRRIYDAMEEGVRKPDLLFGYVDSTGKSRVCAVEYNGGKHDLPAQIAADAVRGNELKAMGLSEYVVRREQYDDLDYMDGLALRIRRELGLPRLCLTRKEAARRRKLRQHLYEELELIDGICWNGKERKRLRAERTTNVAWDEVPIEAYGL